jgi:putative transposase
MAARVHDPEGALQWLAVLRYHCFRLRLLWADQYYRGALGAGPWGLRPWRKVCVEIVKRPDGTKGFLLLSKRWILARTFAWLASDHRLSKDDEY